jgi:hypothetical protein
MLEEGHLVALGQVMDALTLGLGLGAEAGSGLDGVHRGIPGRREWRVASVE